VKDSVMDISKTSVFSANTGKYDADVMSSHSVPEPGSGSSKWLNANSIVRVRITNWWFHKSHPTTYIICY